MDVVLLVMIGMMGKRMMMSGGSGDDGTADADTEDEH